MGDRRLAWVIIAVGLTLIVGVVIVDIVSTDYDLPGVFYGALAGALVYAVKKSVDKLLKKP